MEEVARALANSRFAVAFTGAGISAESGVPTFRGPGGLWERYRPEDLATPEAFWKDPVLVWRWYRWRQELIYNAAPNPAHLALAELESLGVLKAVITQNVDGLHKRAGSRRVVELHGNIWRARCTSCGRELPIEKPVDEIPPRCPHCGGLLRPAVVWFGEPLPRDAWEEALLLASSADFMLVVGTSGVVYPAAYIPRIAKRNGAVVAVVDPGETALDDIADFKIRGRAAEILPRLAAEVRRCLT
ncbi:NAD-dependent deacetylase [Thermoproteus uzoniensis 768-20]|uniref:NAD-dependent protein deacylase n=1 Tax=Thermoproteus uzoniensis (strain 768-20) TaxID=999630 RepID=F2L293_THEU7|nr:NAD-dependent protein deacetylase [Thermoproteus uzoniensis]AEA13020.1 NAD-dependent deacetylase [Thermoproteus uzoniensis 768-20]